MKKINQIKSKYLPKVIGTAINLVGVVMPNKAAMIALDIFRTPRNGRVQSHQKKFLKKFKYKELTCDGMKVATYDDGKSGRSVLLCHGWESNSFRWRKLYRALKDSGLNIIMMDAPGHGNSGSNKFDAKLYAGFINAAISNYKPSVVIGHSVGGYSIIYAVADYGAPSVDKMVVLASPDKFEDISSRYFKMIGLSKRIQKRYYQKVEEMFGKPSSYYNAADFAAKIDASALIIHDQEDMINLYYEGEAIHKSWKNSVLKSTKGHGHSLQDDSIYDMIKSYIS